MLELECVYVGVQKHRVTTDKKEVDAETGGGYLCGLVYLCWSPGQIQHQSPSSIRGIFVFVDHVLYYMLLIPLWQLRLRHKVG